MIWPYTIIAIVAIIIAYIAGLKDGRDETAFRKEIEDLTKKYGI